MTTTINASTSSGLVNTADTSGILQLQTASTAALTIDANQRTAFVAGTAALPAITTDGDTNTGIFFPAADTIAFSEGGAESMRIDASGNVGIGGTPSYKLQVTATATSDGAYITNSNADGTTLYLNNSSTSGRQFRLISTGSGNGPGAGTLGIFDGTANAYRAVIDSSGNFLVNRTSSFTPNTADNTKGFGILASSGQTMVNATGGVNAFIVNNTDSANRIVSFRYANTEVGGVTTTTSTATFNGTSDSRLKEDLGVSTDTSVIDNTIIHDFKWTRDGTQGKGVFAQEAYEVYPLAISKGSDELNESGNLSNPWQVNYSQYIPDLIVYCQQLKKTVDTQAELISGQAATINALVTRIEALENK